MSMLQYVELYYMESSPFEHVIFEIIWYGPLLKLTKLQKHIIFYYRA